MCDTNKLMFKRSLILFLITSSISAHANLPEPIAPSSSNPTTRFNTVYTNPYSSRARREASGNSTVPTAFAASRASAYNRTGDTSSTVPTNRFANYPSTISTRARRQASGDSTVPTARIKLVQSQYSESQYSKVEKLKTRNVQAHDIQVQDIETKKLTLHAGNTLPTNPKDGTLAYVSGVLCLYMVNEDLGLASWHKVSGEEELNCDF